MLFPDVPTLHLLKAQLMAAENRLGEAEAEYLETLRLNPCDECWYALARLYVAEKRYREAEHALQQSEKMSLVPHERVRSLGQLYLLMNQPQAALSSFARAEAISPFDGDAANQGQRFRAQIAEGRARAYRQLNKLDEAVVEEQAAVQLDPQNPARWTALADLYLAQGQTEKAAQAREKADALEKEAGGSLNPPATVSKK